MIPTRLTGVEVRPVRFPLRHPFVTALGRKTHSDNVLVKIRLASGECGWGEASSSLAMPWQTGPRMAAALRRLARRFQGRDIRDVDAVVSALWKVEASFPTAAAAFECALWDAFAASQGVPFFRLWGDASREIETLMSVAVAPPAVVAARVRDGRRAGFRLFKLKLDGRDPEPLNLDRLRAAHRAAPRARLLADPNQSFSPASLSSLLLAVKTAGLPLVLVEEPFPKKSWKDLRAFRGKSAVPIILDETVQAPADARKAFQGRLSQGVNVKLAKSGLYKGAEILKAFPAGTHMIGCMAESKVGLSAAAHFALGTGAFTYADLDSDLLLKPLPVRGGYIRRGPWLCLPKNPPPGLGLHP